MIIGLSGFAGVGKSTVAKVLVEQHGFVEVSIADPLKRAAMDIFDFTNGQLWGQSKRREEPDNRYPRGHTWSSGKGETHCACCGVDANAPETRCYLTPRYALQLLGTEFGRHCYDSIWIECVLRNAIQVLKEKDTAYSASNGVYRAPSTMRRYRGVVIPDVRFRNELDGIKRFGKHQNDLIEKLVEQWHNQQQVGAAREQPLNEFLEMTDEEYLAFAKYGLHRTSSYVVKVSRPGFDKPRYQHQSELEQLEFKLEEFDYNFVGVNVPEGLSSDETLRKISASVAEGVADMIGSFLKLK